MYALRNTPRSIRDLLDKCDRAESGIESIVRLRLRARRIQVQVQVVIAGVGRVDLLIGRRLIVEVDGQEYHADRLRFETDRERDWVAAELGYLVIRLSYQQVIHHWSSAERSILAVVRRGDHLRPLPPRVA
ncbi:hypothetical protein GCM10009624_11610 [Gordonia sinesedis]